MFALPSTTASLLALGASAILLLVVRPLAIILWEAWRHPQKGETLRVLINHTREFCEKNPELIGTDRFHTELLESALSALEAARQTPFPLSIEDTLYAVLLGAHKSKLLDFNAITRTRQCGPRRSGRYSVPISSDPRAQKAQ